MLCLSYDKTTSKTLSGEKLRYGILYGNEKIVFIKVGAGGSIRGYQYKYLQMAHRAHERLGATVICASNPDIEHGHEDADRAMIASVAAEAGFASYEVYFVGTSDGGYHNLKLAKIVPQSVKFLGINASLNSVQDLTEKLQAIPDVQKLLVYGTKDEDYIRESALQALKCDNLEVITITGADHEFTGMVDEFIALIDLI
jgi:alpha/beta superfamily hydrolase